jgi:hypothetical protein
MDAEHWIPFLSFIKKFKFELDHDMEISEGQEDGVKICLQNSKWNKAE